MLKSQAPIFKKIPMIKPNVLHKEILELEFSDLDLENFLGFGVWLLGFKDVSLLHASNERET
jgi:hypothetical protein